MDGTVISRIVTLIAVAAGIATLIAACAADSSPPGPPAAPDTVFGIQLGAAIETQFNECPRNAQGTYEHGYHGGPSPCWKTAKYGKEIALPARFMRETGALIDSTPRIRVRDGVVVEIDVEAHRDTWRQAEAYMLRHYGTPLKTETYERDSRVWGRSRHRAHTWRARGVSLYFTERASSDNARIRAVNDAWEKSDAAEKEAIRSRANTR